MILKYKNSCLSILTILGFLISGCGKKPEGEVRVENFDSPPQVTITLHSQLELDYSLDPESRLESSEDDADETDEERNNFIDNVYAKLKSESRKRNQGKPLPKFKADPGYQSLERYEKIDPQRYAITFQKSPGKPPVRKTVKVQDKPLIFAGRGYNISAFEKEVKPAVDVDYSTHLVDTPIDPPVKNIKDHLDKSTGYTRDTKNLVYNATRSARFGKSLPSLIDNKSDLAIKDKSESLRNVEPVILPERNPDSVLLFPRGEESLLVLRKAEKQFDLLEGNESLNKKQFNASSMVPGTSSKTPSTQ
jgi:hypothetical protein